MRFVGYIKAFKENSFTIPIYSDGVDFFYHCLDEFYTVVDFIKTDIVNEEILKRIYLSTVFKKGSIGACVFAGNDDYIFFNQADKIIDEIISYLDETTSLTEFTNVKREVSILKKLLIKEDLNSKSSEIMEEEITFSFDLPDTNKLITKELNESGIIRYSLEEYMALENDILKSKSSNPFKETIIKKYMEKVLLNKSMHHTDKEIIFNLFQNFLNDNNNALEEIVLNTEVGRDFSYYLSNNNNITISPVELSIEETLKFRADERRRKLKNFNYQFVNHNWERIKEMESVPAYKRLGIDLTDLPPSDSSLSKVTIWVETKKFDEKNSNNEKEATKTTTNSG